MQINKSTRVCLYTHYGQLNCTGVFVQQFKTIRLHHPSIMYTTYVKLIGCF